MEKERSTKIIAIVALVVSVVGLSVGFAAFSKDLNITFSESSVTPGGSLDLKFVVSEDDKTGTNKTVTAKLNGATAANDATIAGDASSISGLTATFTDKGQSVDYDFYIYNASEYDAYLRKVTFENYTGQNKNKVCTAIGATNVELVANACDDITLSISVGGENVTSTLEDGFSTPEIEHGKTIPVKITISYAGDSLLPNGDFKINFGAIKLSYSSLASSN